jgi:mRNA interferase MazF
LTNDDFSKGSLRVVSYARPGKLFTANRELMVAQAGVLSAAAFERVRDAVVGVLRPVRRG